MQIMKYIVIVMFVSHESEYEVVCITKLIKNKSCAKQWLHSIQKEWYYDLNEDQSLQIKCSDDKGQYFNIEWLYKMSQLIFIMCIISL